MARPKDKELAWFRSQFPGLSETSIWRLRKGLQSLQAKGGSIEPYLKRNGQISVRRLFEDAER